MAVVDLPKTAMIFPTSAAFIGGLRGSVTNVGVKRMLIHRSDQPACACVISAHDLSCDSLGPKECSQEHQ